MAKKKETDDEREKRLLAQNRERVRKFRTKHPEEIRARKRLYRESHVESIRAYFRRYFQTPKGIAVARRAHAKRHALKVGATIGEVDVAALFARDKGRCQICRKKVDPKNWHMDHVIPLSKGGEHNMRNLRVTHPICNRRKGSRKTTLF